MYFAILKKNIMSGTGPAPMVGKINPRQVRKKRRFAGSRCQKSPWPTGRWPRWGFCHGAAAKFKNLILGALGSGFKRFRDECHVIPWAMGFFGTCTVNWCFFSVRRLDWSNLVANHLPFNQWINRNAWSVELHHSKKRGEKTQPLTNRYYIYTEDKKSDSINGCNFKQNGCTAFQTGRGVNSVSRRQKTQEGNAADHSTENLWTFFRLKGWGENSGTIECWFEMRHIFSNPSSHNHGSVENDGKWVYLQYLFPFI